MWFYIKPDVTRFLFVTVINVYVIFCVLSIPIAVAEITPLQLTEQEQAWIKANSVVTVANEMDWPPFDYVDNGNPAGYSIDVVRLIKQKTGLQIRFVNGYAWSELLQLFKAGKIDVMPAVYIDEERHDYMLFTRSYYSQPSVMVVHKDNKDINNIASLNGKRVVGIRGFVITNTLKKVVPNISVLEVDNIIEAMKAVSIGEADAFIDSIGTVSYNLEHNYIPNLKVIGRLNNETLENPPLHFSVAKNNPLLRSILDKALASISRNEQLTLEKRWIHKLESIGKQSASKKIVLTAEQRAWLSEHPVIRIGIDAGYAPYSFLDNDGSFVGVAPDFISLIGEKLGITMEAVPDLAWPKIIQKARERSLDVIATAVITDDRKSFLNFTQIYIPTPLVIMSHIDDNRVVEVSDLDNLSVALVDGYSSSKRVIQEHPTAKIIKVANPVEGLHAVSSGKADVYVGVVGINIYQAQKQGVTNLKIAGNYDVETNGQRFAVRSDWNELALILDRALDSISEQERKAIYDKWIDIPYVEQVDYSLLWNVLVAFIIIVSLMYLHSRRLNQEISRRKVVEQELLELNKNLIQARDEADHANRAKSKFLSSMSHELRTPLTAILGFSQLLEVEQSLSEEQKDFTHEILQASNHLLGLINEVLDLAKIEAGHTDLSIEPVEFDGLISECISLVKPIADRSNIKISNSSEIENIILKVDRIRMKQILVNLLSNAIKYNCKDGQVRILTSMHDKDSYRISIEDTGTGIKKENMGALFAAFNRLSAENSTIEGTGIGLVITKRLVELMGGKIGVKSEYNMGSTFWLEMPKGSLTAAAVSDLEDHRAIPQDTVVGKDYKILYIEDNPINLKLLSLLFDHKAHLHLDTASTPSTGLAMAESKHPDLILLDIHLPEMNGYEVLRKLRSNTATKDIPVVAASADAMPGDMSKANKKGFDGYVTKPFDVKHLYKTIDRILINSGKAQ